MMFPPTNNKHPPSRSFHLVSIRFTKPLVLLFTLTFLSMSTFYQVMGSTRCPKIKKHPGLKLKPVNHSGKEPFVPGDVILYSCETNEQKQSIKCLEDGRWSELPVCLDPTNHTCPELGPLQYGSFNASVGVPLKVGTVVAFKCDSELINLTISSNNNLTSGRKTNSNNKEEPNLKYTIPTTTLNANINEIGEGVPTTLATPKPLLASSYEALQSQQITTNQPIIAERDNYQTPLRYNLTGHRLLRCLPSSKWNHPMPTCLPVLPEPQSNVGLVLTSAFLILLPILIFVAILQLFIRWKKRQQQRERWKQYFTDYKYRHSKTSITFGTKLATTSSNLPTTSTAAGTSTTSSNSSNNINGCIQSDTKIPVTDL